MTNKPVIQSIIDGVYQDLLINPNGGNVSINTEYSEGYQLNVNGTIKTKDITINGGTHNNVLSTSSIDGKLTLNGEPLGAKIYKIDELLTGTFSSEDTSNSINAYVGKNLLQRVTAIETTGSQPAFNGVGLIRVNGSVISYDNSNYLKYAGNPNDVQNANFAIGTYNDRNFIQSHSSLPLDLNPLGNAVTVNNQTIWHSGNFNPNGKLDYRTFGSAASSNTDQFINMNWNRFAGDANTLGLANTTGVYNISSASNVPSYYGTLLGFWNEDISTQLYLGYNGDMSWRKSIGTSYTGSVWRTVWDSVNFNPANYLLKTGGNMSGNISFDQPVGLTFGNGQYIKDNSAGGLIIYSNYAINTSSTSIIHNTSSVLINNGTGGVVSLGDSNHFIKSVYGDGITIGTYQAPNGIKLYQTSFGNVTIGYSTDQNYKLAVNGGALMKDLHIYNPDGGVGRLYIQGSQANAKSYSLLNGITAISNAGFEIHNDTNNTSPFYIDGSDNSHFGGTINANGIYSNKYLSLSNITDNDSDGNPWYGLGQKTDSSVNLNGYFGIRLKTNSGNVLIDSSGGITSTGNVNAVVFNGNGAGVFNVNAAYLGGRPYSDFIYYINRMHSSDGTSSNQSGCYQTFDYDTCGAGISGGLISFGGLSGNYATQLIGRYGDGLIFKMRTRNGDAGTWNAWRELWHNGNFNPNNYQLASTAINTSNISSQSVNYANTSDASNRMNYIDINTTTSNQVQFYQSSLNNSYNDNPTGSWATMFKMSHGDGNTYYNRRLAFPFWGNDVYVGGRTGGTETSWEKLIHSKTIGTFWTGTKAEFDALTKDANTMYIII